MQPEGSTLHHGEREKRAIKPVLPSSAQQEQSIVDIQVIGQLLPLVPQCCTCARMTSPLRLALSGAPAICML